jgi:hypothetical protein
MMHRTRRSWLLRAVLGVAGFWSAGLSAAPPAENPAPSAGQLIDRAAWLRFLGWSADGRRIAWRSGSPASSNVPGQPCLVARLDDGGRELDRLRIDESVTEALVSRRIHSVPAVPRERVTPRDMLVRSSNGQLWAALGRDRLAAVLVKARDGYQPLWRWPLRAVVTAIDLTAFENAQGDLLALVVQLQLGRHSAAALLVVPTQLDLPATATPSGTASADSPQAGAPP